ncbi:hypothetical protein T10_3556 [Trichinella papuae]|uniref:Uncharacterized protein n=1 Tax=Trichinella papuae TaxID=268474 RepID=A0A0V1MMC0_9BILA|nr:hypothetical protein T10_3556 [Trichinella papuae]
MIKTAKQLLRPVQKEKLKNNQAIQDGKRTLDEIADAGSQPQETGGPQIIKRSKTEFKTIQFVFVWSCV